MEDLDAASLDDVRAFFKTYYAPNNAVLSVVGDVDTDANPRERRALLRRDPRESVDPGAWRPVAATDTRPRDPRGRARSRPLATDLRWLPRTRVRRSPARRARGRRPDPVGRQGRSRPPSSARTRRADRPGRSRSASSVALRCRGLATVRPSVAVDRVEAAFHEEVERLAVEPAARTVSSPGRGQLIEADGFGAVQRVEERADRLSMYATLFDRPALINEMLGRYLAVTPEAILEAAAATFRTGQSTRADLCARDTAFRRERGYRRRWCRDRGRGGGRVTIESTEREVVVAERLAPGTPRPYAFPSVAGGAGERLDHPDRGPAGPPSSAHRWSSRRGGGRTGR